MDTRKVTFIATIAAIVLVAVGIGYAYTAMTTNSGNNASTEYITLIQGEAGAYTFADGSQQIYWDTNDYKSGVEFKTDFTLTGVTLDGTAVGAAANAYTLVQLGKAFTLEPQRSGTGALPAINIEVNSENLLMPSGPVIFLKAETAGAATQYYKLMADNTFEKGLAGGGDNKIAVTVDATPEPDVYKPITITMLYGFAGSGDAAKVTVAHAAGVQPVGPSDKPLNNTKLTFRITTPGANTPGEVPVTGISISAAATTVNKGGTVVITPTFTPAEPTNQGIIWTTSNSTIATVSGGTVTAQSVAGQVTITATTAEGSYVASVVISVNPTVTFDRGAATSGSIDPQNVTYNTATALTTVTDQFTYAGHSFAGWNTSADGKGISYANSADVKFTQDTTLYAMWTETP